ncbi:MAG: TRAP transporter permease [Candidatus Adiutrix sp.]|nr:TRAP transporter permease [Candidatus Adiutrix sp.]
MTSPNSPAEEGAAALDLDGLLRKYDTESRFRPLAGWQGRLVTALALAMACFHLYTSGFGLLQAQTQGAVHLAFALVLTLLLFPFRQGRRHDYAPWPDFLLAGLAAAACLYLVFNFLAIARRSGTPNATDLVMGLLLIIMILEATRRISNPVLSGLAIAALLYCLFGRAMPQMLRHGGFSPGRIINHMYLGTEGLFGTPLEVSSTYVFMFILFGAVLERTGIGRFIIDLSLALAGWSSGGPAKVAVVASGLMGTVSGSSVANVCTTGMFTIPLMKSVGYQGAFAGAVEAVASTGGQIMPPVMGAVAFIMAQMMGRPYLEVAVAAIIPALLYYAAVMVQVHFEARRLGLRGLPRERLPKVWRLLRTKGFLLLPLAAIIYFLLSGNTPLKAAFYGILICVPLSWLNRETRLTPAKLLEAFEAGARSSLSVACACACVGMIVGTGTLTGLALRIAGGIVDLAGGHLLPTLLLTMCASILLGTGLPTTANFIVTSTMVAPALFKLGVPPMAAYMFVFYFGIAADLTPPVALAAYAGAGIAGADPMRTGFKAFRLALAGFLVPYIYIYHPILLFDGHFSLELLQAVFSAVLGVFLLSMTTIGHYRAHLNWPWRFLALAGAVSLLVPGTKSDLAGLIVLAFIHIIQTAKARSGRPVHSTATQEEENQT